MIIPNLTIKQSIFAIKNCMNARQKKYSGPKPHLVLEPYQGMSDSKLNEELLFFEQLAKGWIKVPRIKVNADQIKQVYEKSTFDPTGSGFYREIQGYAYSECPKFIEQSFEIKLWSSTGFLRCMPGKVIPRHKDMGRVAGLLIPFEGEQDSIPLSFYDDNKQKISEVIVDGPTLIDTTVQHAVEIASDKERINFNLCFTYPHSFESIADLLVRRNAINTL